MRNTYFGSWVCHTSKHPGEAEARSTYIAAQGRAWTAASRDYDSILFGAPQLVRYVIISGSEFLPSQGVSRPLETKLIHLNEMPEALGLSREQLINVTILIGTDFN